MKAVSLRIDWWREDAGPMMQALLVTYTSSSARVEVPVMEPTALGAGDELRLVAEVLDRCSQYGMDHQLQQETANAQEYAAVDHDARGNGTDGVERVGGESQGQDPAVVYADP